MHTNKNRMLIGLCVLLAAVTVIYFTGMNNLSYAAKVILSILVAALIFFTQFQGILSLYQVTISLLGLFKNKKTYQVENNSASTRFAVLVCAHNEEKVIEQIVQNLKNVDYPKEQYDIHVICDNCTDETAQIVRENGVNAWERQDSQKRGKGYGLEWMFQNLFRLEKENKQVYDAVVILDADNIVSRNFLQVLNHKLVEEKYEAVQAYLDSKNPKDNWISKSYALSYWSTNRLYQLSRGKLGLSAQLGGTGMCFSMHILKEMGWGTQSLTEDLEFTAKYILATGKSVGWAHDAKIFDEKPTDFKVSFRQRVRWMQGHMDCMVRYSVPLLKKFMQTFNMNALDMFIYLIQPTRTMLSVNSIILFFVTYYELLPTSIMPYVLSPWIWLMIALSFYMLPVIALFQEKKVKSVIWTPIVYIFGFSWVPIIFLGFIKRKQKVWVHTPHSRVMDKDNMVKMEELT
ncbi:glycosyl transferase [Bacillus pseudomycoides]|uniref:Glycosyl transferase n=1 Tax=Bacillus pseudomycoides TaxID=64104 RepID=A0AA91V8A7_9BACI|nr:MULTISPECIES: glycosyltransferase family 2 protein [Bacillus]PEB55356.1 glycosyl transferase [Bacillus sp. AFS098217]PED80104.1 glycosyl transferase [Bacillus pseudomycoides]PEU12526.1 glycosyl transferase [Bacillus sp. AFS019443]PEU22485.1 glycosyl transferase [Bacillus sp. AFS014408]PFW60588.1 glycosyl transferase [Bacillus sp. AFS075034]